MNKNLSKLMIMTLALAPAGSVLGQVIRLEQAVQVERRQDVRLGDIAKVTGTDRETAEALSNTVILSGIEGSRTLKSETVLLALMSQHGGGLIGNNLQVSGAATCRLQVEVPVAAAPKAMAAAQELPVVAKAPVQAAVEVKQAAQPAPMPVLVDDAALRPQGLIEALVQKELKIAADHIAVEIETKNPLLDQPVGNKKWTIRPLTKTFVGTAQFEAILSEGPRIVAKLTLTTRIKRLQTVVMALRGFARGDVVEAGDVKVSDEWLDRPLANLLADPTVIIGMEATKAQGVGGFLEAKDFRTAIMASKSDQVTILYKVGNLEVRINGMAMEEGKLHSVISVRAENSKELYQVTLVGKRLGVMGELAMDMAKNKQELR